MEFKKSSIGVQPEIRKRVTDGDVTVPVTLDFSAVTTKNGEEKVVKAGSPIDKDGKVANTASAVGILLTDVYEARPIGTIIKHGCVNVAVANKNAGIEIADEVKTALPLIIFE